MKTLVSIIALLCSFMSFAQLSISTNYRQDATFKHTTETITSDYFISKWDYNEEEVKYTMNITSDVGNEYEMIIDGINNCVAIFYWYEGQYVLVRHTIEQTWFNEAETVEE
jgi:hypothetical protein